jgi:hypothetical protein
MAARALVEEAHHSMLDRLMGDRGRAGAASSAAAKGCRAKAAMIIRERLALIFNAQLKHIKNGSNILREGGSASLDQYN